MKNNPSNHQAIGWAGSLLLHGGIITFVAFYAYFYSFSIQGDVRVTATSEAVPAAVREIVTPSPDPAHGNLLSGTDRALAQRVSTREGVKSVLQEAQTRAQELPIDEKMAILDKQSARIDQIKQADVAKMTDYVESAFGITPATTQPDTQPAKTSTTFDPDSGRYSDIIPAIGPKKEPGYLWTLTDAHANTISYFTPASEMSPDDLRLAELFEKARRSPNFKSLLNTAIKLASKKRADEKAQQPPK